MPNGGEISQAILHMIIDNRIVWYGGIDILGRCLNEQSLIRIYNEALANELTGIIYEHISQ